MLKINLMVFGLLISLLGIFSDTGVYGADWKFLKANVEGKFFYDAENVTRSAANIVGVWLKIVYSEKFKEQEDLTHLSQTIGLWEIDCKDKKMCLLSTSHTSKEVEISAPQVWLPPDWKSIPPYTIMDTLYEEVCK
jgi:hypothetical protein